MSCLRSHDSSHPGSDPGEVLRRSRHLRLGPYLYRSVDIPAHGFGSLGGTVLWFYFLRSAHVGSLALVDQSFLGVASWILTSTWTTASHSGPEGPSNHLQRLHNTSPEGYRRDERIGNAGCFAWETLVGQSFLWEDFPADIRVA